MQSSPASGNMKPALQSSPTSVENIVINLLYELLGESQWNRTADEYQRIAERLPKLAVIHAYANQRLREFKNAGIAPYEICYFKPGDR